MSEALEQTFRDSCILARLAGDEFAVLAMEASTQIQEVILRRLEKSLKKSNASQSRYAVSLSVGLARFAPKHPVLLGALIAQAVQAIYEQKRRRLAACLSKPQVGSGRALHSQAQSEAEISQQRQLTDSKHRRWNGAIR